MKLFIYAILVFFTITSCSKTPNSFVLSKKLPNTYLLKSSFEKLPNIDDKNLTKALKLFVNNCETKKAKLLYKGLCTKALNVEKPKEFLVDNFDVYKININSEKDNGLLTGYYEPELKGSLFKTGRYQFPIYETPDDLIEVDLSSIYPKLKHLRLRGRLDGKKIVPYYTRKESNSIDVDADAICYVDSKIDLFFLEIQGSGRVVLDNNKTIYIGYANQNGHRYRAIGRYLISIGALTKDEVSLQAIRKWLNENPSRVDEVLNYNKSVVYFSKKDNPATGALGLELIPKHSIAVDRKYIPLGSMLYMDASIDNENLNNIVMAHDTGGAIKGAIRADLFLGFGKDAREIAGKLKAPLKLWILLPKNKQEDTI